MRRHPKNSKRSGGTRWKPPELTKQEMKIYLKQKRESDKREDEERDIEWRKECERTSVRD